MAKSYRFPLFTARSTKRNAFDVPQYLVEVYLPKLPPTTPTGGAADVRRAARELPGEGRRVHLERSIIVPDR